MIAGTASYAKSLELHSKWMSRRRTSDYGVGPCLKLSENCSLGDPAALYSLCEKQAERYLRGTKSGVLTGFSSLQKRCITKNEHCCSSLEKFLSFVSWKA